MDKVSLDQLEKAVIWFKAHGSVTAVTVETHPGYILIKGFDKNDRSVIIKLCRADTNIKAQITKTEILQ